jgi:hypothetical protein
MNIPVAAFLLSELQRSTWPRDKVDFENKSKLDAFRDLCKTKMVLYWTDSGSLASKCQLAINGLIRRFRRPGWVSGDQAMDPSVLVELARLSRENAELRSQIESCELEKKTHTEREKLISRLRTPMLDLLVTYRDIVNFELPNKVEAKEILQKIDIFYLLSKNLSDFFDGCPTGVFERNLASAFNQYSKNRQLVSIEWTDYLMQFVTKLLRSWGFLDVIRVTASNGNNFPILKISDFGRSVTDEILDRNALNGGV